MAVLGWECPGMTGTARINSSVQLAEINRVLSSLGQRLGTVSAGAAVAAIAQAGVYHVRGARWASVSITGQGRFRTLVATAPMAADADALQHSIGQGPTVDPALEGAVHLVEDLPRDRRWPVLAARAAQHLGVAALLVYRLPLPEEPGTTVGLTLYSDVVDAFGAPALWTGSVLASHAVAVVAADHQHRRTLQAQHSAQEVGTAAGMLMARYGIPREEALHLLRTTAQDSHRSIAEIATEIIDTETRRPCSNRQLFVR
ncbi:UNVERIFIED_CONTAM: GAF and ANTAR domain-containing protein [Kocuria sp. CPCC 205316]|uniref:GAF and ANTAR domain-containing protein n=2 Tax=Kocuria TaxID=57493 RepID=UPI0036D88E5E